MNKAAHSRLTAALRAKLQERIDRAGPALEDLAAQYLDQKIGLSAYLRDSQAVVAQRRADVQARLTIGLAVGVVDTGVVDRDVHPLCEAIEALAPPQPKPKPGPTPTPTPTPTPSPTPEADAS